MDYSTMTMSELYAAWIANWKVMQTGIQEILGDEPMPDPREVARVILEMPEDIWTGLFQSDSATEYFRTTMDLQKLMATVQMENVEILNAALALGAQS